MIKSKSNLLHFYTILLFLGFSLSACSSFFPAQGFAPAAETIPALRTEQAALKTEIALSEQAAFTPLPRPTDTSSPTKTAQLPTLTLTTQFSLPRPILFLGQDVNGILQIFRLERDGETVNQLTEEPTSIKDFDISSNGTLAFISQPSADKTELLLLTKNGVLTTVDIRNSANETIDHIRWLPDGDRFVYFRRVEKPENSEEGSLQPIGAELILYSTVLSTSEVLLRSGFDEIMPVESSVGTDQSLRYAENHSWPKEYAPVGFSPDSRFLLLSDTNGPFWAVYDLRFKVVKLINILADSADLGSPGQIVCLTGAVNKPDFQGSEALLCTNLTNNTREVFLINPPWQPFGINYWVAENAVVFLQTRQDEETGSTFLQVYGYNLYDTEPILLREEEFPFNENADTTEKILHSLTENQLDGFVLLAGQAKAMESPGIVLLPLDPRQNPHYFPGLGEVSHLRWAINNP